MTAEVFEAVRHVLARNEVGAMATITATSGSAPQKAGARILLRKDGTTAGTIGGGRVENVILRELEQLIEQEAAPKSIELHLTRDLGMCCGGSMQVFLERIEPLPHLMLFGAGHVAKPTAEMARLVGFRVTVVDDREDLNTPDRFPGCELVSLEPTEALRRKKVLIGKETFGVICTHDHQLDQKTLVVCLEQPFVYLGMVGSRRKVKRAFSHVRQVKPLASTDRVHAPIGLDLGGTTPSEIALSIVSEMVTVRKGGSGRSLRAESGLGPNGTELPGLGDA